MPADHYFHKTAGCPAIYYLGVALGTNSKIGSSDVDQKLPQLRVRSTKNELRTTLEAHHELSINR